jgi:membrane protein DedA with SNARE-associated domain
MRMEFMDQWIAAVLRFVAENRFWAGPVIFGLAFAESMAVLSLAVPFTAMIIGTGALVCGPNAALDPWLVIPWGIAGAVAGDAVSYWIGRYFKDKVPRMWPFRGHPEQLERGYRFFARWGVLSVFIGRFFGPLRAVVPIVAGMLAMRQWKFQIANVTSAIVWLPMLLLPGCLAGRVFADVANLGERVFGYVFVFFLGTTLIGALVAWIRSRRKRAATARQMGPGAGS